MKNKKYFVYSIHCPDTKECVWVGMTSDPFERFTKHMTSAAECNGKRLDWVNSVLSKGKKPEFVIRFWTTSKFEARIEEMRVLGEMKNLGNNLFNTIDDLNYSPKEKKPVKDQYGNIYKSVSEASKVTGCPRKGIRNTIEGKQSSTKGYVFEWATFEMVSLKVVNS